MPTYCTTNDIYDYYGKVNVRKWADYDNDGSDIAIDLNIAKAIDWASAEVDDKLRGGVVTIPFADVTDQPPTPSLIVDIAAKLAGARLYSARGGEDFDPKGRPVDRLAGHRTDAYDRLHKLRTGLMRMEATHYDVTMKPYTDTDADTNCTQDGFTICP